MTNTYTAWTIRLKDGSLGPSFAAPGPLLCRSKDRAKSEVRGRASVKLEPGTPVRVTFIVREVAR